MTQHKKSKATFTDIVPAFLVRGVALIELGDGSRRRVQVSRIVPAPTPDAARVDALQRVAHRLQATRRRWQEVSVRWIANQYMWAFEEESRPREVANGQVQNTTEGGK